MRDVKKPIWIHGNDIVNARGAAGAGLAGIRRWITRLVVGLLGIGALLTAPSPEARAVPQENEMLFEAIDVVVDTGPHALAAYQFELVDPAGTASIVGVEGGEHPAFQEPPYYDPAALRKNRIILAAFHLGPDGPAGSCCVATLHLIVPAKKAPNYRIVLQAAADPDGRDLRPIARIHWQRKKD
jgi:hypothetical protein